MWDVMGGQRTSSSCRSLPSYRVVYVRGPIVVCTCVRDRGALTLSLSLRLCLCAAAFLSRCHVSTDRASGGTRLGFMTSSLGSDPSQSFCILSGADVRHPAPRSLETFYRNIAIMAQLLRSIRQTSQGMSQPIQASFLRRRRVQLSHTRVLPPLVDALYRFGDMLHLPRGGDISLVEHGFRNQRMHAALSRVAPPCPLRYASLGPNLGRAILPLRSFLC
eukprot:1243474-Rhodomonas_salina.2